MTQKTIAINLLGYVLLAFSTVILWSGQDVRQFGLELPLGIGLGLLPWIVGLPYRRHAQAMDAAWMMSAFLIGRGVLPLAKLSYVVVVVVADTLLVLWVVYAYLTRKIHVSTVAASMLSIVLTILLYRTGFNVAEVCVGVCTANVVVLVGMLLFNRHGEKGIADLHG